MTVTRWWWIRHAPVDSKGLIYGQEDLEADCADLDTFTALAGLLPEDPVWVVSHLQRTHQTAKAVLAALDREAEFLIEPDFAEQHFGSWQGRRHEDLAAERDGAWHRFWHAPASEAPPGGESFTQLTERVGAAIERLTIAHTGRDIVAVAHGGTIRAAIAVALGIDPERALGIATANCGLTRLDHIAGAPGSHAPEIEGVWRVAGVNISPKAFA